MAQAPEPGGYVKSDVVVGPTTGEPRPCAVAQLELLELVEASAFLVVQTIVVEKDTHVASSLALILGLSHPRGLHEGDRFQILVLFQGTIQSLGSLPLVEDSANLGIGIGDLTSQGVGI